MVYDLFRALPGEPAFATVARTSSLHELGACMGAPGPHDFAVRDDAARLTAHPRPSHSAPRFVTIAIRPSCRRGTGTTYGKSEFLKSGIFLRAGLDRNSRRPPDGQITSSGCHASRVPRDSSSCP